MYSNYYLLLAEDEVVELLLEHLVGVVDQKLLEVVVREDLKTCPIRTKTQAQKHKNHKKTHTSTQ